MAQQTDLLARLGLAAYNAMTAAAAPATVVRLALQHWRGEEPIDTTLERLGVANVRRPKGPLVWFHAVTVAECAVALPVVFRCLLEYNENVHVLLTTGTPEAHALLAGSLPRRLVLRHAPFENAASVAAFLRAWRPQVGVFVESPSWPLLVEAAGAAGLRLALLNARMSTRWFRRNFGHAPARAMAGRVLSRFTLIVPQSDVDVGRFRILGATMRQMPGWCSDLKYAAALGTSVWHACRPSAARILALRRALAGRPVWVAANTHDGEEELIGGVHASLKKEWPGVLTILAPRQPSRAGEVAAALRSAAGLRVAVWSSGGGERGGGASGALRPPPVQGIDVLLLEAAADLPLAYCVAEVAFIGNSLLEGYTGHNLAEAAVAGCAVVVGQHAGHFGQMAEELNQAAVMAAEEAAAAVNSSSALLDDSYPFHSQHEAAAAAGEEAAFAGPHDGTEESPREPGSHWGSLLEDIPYRPSSGRESAGGGSRPATAPAAVPSSRDHRAQFASASPSAAARGRGPAADDSTAASPSAAAAAYSGFECASPLGSAGGSGVFDGGSPAAAHMLVSPLRRRALVDSGDGSTPPPVPPVPPPTMGTNTPAGEEDGGASPVGGRSWAGGAAAAATAMAAAAGRGLPPRGGAAAAAAAAVMATARRGSGAGAGLEVGGQQQDGGGAAIDEPSAEGWLGLATVAAAASTDEGGDGGPLAEQGAGLPPPVPPQQQQQQQQQSGRGAAQGPGAQISGAIKRSHGGRAGGPGDGSSVDNSRSNSYANTPRCFPMTPVTPTTPHATPDDSAHAMGGRSPHLGSSANSGPGAPPFGLPASAAALTQALRWPNGPAARSGSGSGGAASGAGSGGPASGPGAAAAAANGGGSGPPLWPCVRPLAGDEGSEPGTPLHVYGVPPPQQQQAAPQQHAGAAGLSAAAAAALGVGRGSYDGGRPDSPVPNRGPLQRGSEGGGGGGAFLLDSASFGLGRCSSDGCLGMGPGYEDSVPLGRCPTVGELIRLRGASDAGGSGGGRPMRVSELGLTSTSSEGGAGGRGAGSGADSSGGGSAGGRQPVDLYPGEAPCAAGDAEALERQGSMGWEGWRQDAEAAAAAEQQQQQQQQQGRPAAARGGRSRLSVGGDTADPSPLGDPGRAAHFMDGGAWQQQQQQQQQQVMEAAAGVHDRPPALSRLNVSHHHQRHHHHQQQQRQQASHHQPGSRSTVLGGGDGSAPPTQPGTASSIGLGSSAAQHQAWRGLGLLGGEAQSPTSLSGYSPRSTLSDGQTPSWARQTPQSAHAAADGSHPWRSYSGSSLPAGGAPPPVRHAARRQPSGYTPRLPRHDESDAGGSDTPGSLADAGYGPDSRRLLGRASGDSPSAPGGPTGGGSAAGAAGFTDGRLGGGGGGGPVARASSIGGASVCGIPPVPAGGGAVYGGAGTSYMRYAGDYILPATHLPYSPQGPAVWQVSGAEGLASAVATLLREPLERRSRGHAAAQGAAKLASGLVSTVWHVLDDMVVAPGLNEYLAATRPPADHPHAAAAGARAGARR